MELDPAKDSISITGSRCVLVKYSHLRKYFVLELRDFNPYRVRARRARSGSKTATNAGIATHAVLSAEACFEEDVVSELPFVSIRKENVGSRVFMGDEWMAEILVRMPFFVLTAFGKLVVVLTITDSWIEMSKHRSSISVLLLLPRKYALDRMACALAAQLLSSLAFPVLLKETNPWRVSTLTSHTS